jgi:hypothetical protein
MRQKALQAEDRLIEMKQGPIGVIALVVECAAGFCHVIGGFGAELRETQSGHPPVLWFAGSGFRFRRHGAPFPPHAQHPGFGRPKPSVVRPLRLRLR